MRESSTRHRLHEIIFEADTRWGKAFDILLLAAIILSVACVMLESVDSIREDWGSALLVAEWIFTVLFTIEYALRLYVVRATWRYAVSFFGIVDLVSIAPTYLSVLLPGAQSLLVIRILRLLRIFRVLKLTHFVFEAKALSSALSRTRRKIIVFLGSVLTIVVIMGTVMYLVEANAGSGFTSIPRSVYWAVVTLTTVGYGDIAPTTPLGQFLAGTLMVLGYAIIAVPTGIVTAELATQPRSEITTQVCPNCAGEGHDLDAVFCKYCGQRL